MKKIHFESMFIVFDGRGWERLDENYGDRRPKTEDEGGQRERVSKDKMFIFSRLNDFVNNYCQDTKILVYLLW